MSREPEIKLDGMKIARTEQWEWTAYWLGEEATGGSEGDAELNLLRKIVKKKIKNS